MRLLTVPGVFRPRSDGWLLVEVMLAQRPRGRTALDVFTGSGIVAVSAAVAGASHVSAVDVSRRAILCARVNGLLNGARVHGLRGDLFDPVRGRRFDLVTANPPYVPSPERPALPERGAARAWEGGADGRALLDRFCGSVHEYLEPGGTALLVQSSLADTSKSIEQLRETGLEATVAASKRGPIGPLVEARADALERAGLLSGERVEEIVVISASKRFRARSVIPSQYPL